MERPPLAAPHPAFAGAPAQAADLGLLATEDPVLAAREARDGLVAVAARGH